MIFQTILEGIRLDALPVLVCAVGMAVIAAALAGMAINAASRVRTQNMVNSLTILFFFMKPPFRSAGRFTPIRYDHKPVFKVSAR